MLEVGLGVGLAPGVDVSENDAAAKQDGPPCGETGVSIAEKVKVFERPEQAFTLATVEKVWDPGGNGFDIKEPMRLSPLLSCSSVTFTGVWRELKTV
jgi:hypothetical protein